MKLLVCGTGSYRRGGIVGPARWPHHDLIVVTGGALTLRCGTRELAMMARYLGQAGDYDRAREHGEAAIAFALTFTLAFSFALALAFSFAVFRSRPSPFYMMDEVEAALDDVNLQRFLSLVADFRDEAQLLIVTHQKRTMESADALYGVTMKPGESSKVVSQRVARKTSTGTTDA